jgi:hypothetical protein
MNKKQISVLLLLITFVFYAVSPVLYTINKQQTGLFGSMPETGDSITSSFHILYLSIFLSHLADSQDQESTSSSQFLLKKAKAVLKSLIDIKKVYSEFSTFCPDLSFGSPLFFVKCTKNNAPKPHDNSLSFFSGLSPPSVYQLIK